MADKLWGAKTDYFGLATENLVLISSSPEPREQNRSDAADDWGDIFDTMYYGNPTGAIKEVSSTYALYSGSFNLNSIKLGQLPNQMIITGVDVDTSNTEWPQLVVTGLMGMPAVQVPTGSSATFTLPDIEIQGQKRAQPLGFTTSQSGFRLTSTSLSASCSTQEGEDGVGEIAAVALSADVMTMEATFVLATAQAAWVLEAGWTQKKNPAAGAEEPQADWHTATGSAEMILARDGA